MDLYPTKATFRPGEDVELLAEGEVGGRLVVSRLGEPVHECEVRAGDRVLLSGLPIGGYAATLAPEVGSPLATAFDILESPLQRPRYGFLSEFGPDRDDVGDAGASLRRHHLNVVQFYDWAFRHEQLVGPEEEFVDPCGRTLSHETARRLIEECRSAGSLALGYAAVYGVGHDYAAHHPGQLLYHRDRTPWALADLLEIGNLALGNPWRAHIIDQFATAVSALGFDGLHLDTYGAPKVAWDADGRPVDLAPVFPGFLEDTRAALPDAALFFNNVNDYPTWTSIAAPLDSTYIEVWDPHTDYQHLRSLLTTAQLGAPGRPVVLAAYLTAFAQPDVASAEWSARLALATVFAHGGHYLLCGEVSGVLTHPYYPNFARVGPGSEALLRAYLDFAVAHGDVLYDPQARDVTHAHFSSNENDDLAVSAPVPVGPDPVAGSLWCVLRKSPDGLALHLIDLTAQDSPAWNEPKRPGGSVAGVSVRVRCAGDIAFAGSPESGPHLAPLQAARHGDHLCFEVPPFQGWAMVHLPDPH